MTNVHERMASSHIVIHPFALFSLIASMTMLLRFHAQPAYISMSTAVHASGQKQQDVKGVKLVLVRFVNVFRFPLVNTHKKFVCAGLPNQGLKMVNLVVHRIALKLAILKVRQLHIQSSHIQQIARNSMYA